MTNLDRESFAQALDQLIPLKGASHKDVTDYNVTVPMRYAEVSVRLVSGAIATLADPKQFLGWIGYDANPTLLFDCGGGNLVLNRKSNAHSSKAQFIGRDGMLIPASITANC